MSREPTPWAPDLTTRSGRQALEARVARAPAVLVRARDLGSGAPDPLAPRHPHLVVGVAAAGGAALDHVVRPDAGSGRVLRRRLDLVRVEDLGERLEHAVAQARAVEHRALVRLIDVGEDDGRPFVTSAWVDGTDLGHRYAAGPPEPAEAVAVLEQLAHALDAVHAAGQVHGDLGSASVLVRDTPAGLRAYLAGLGVRRAMLAAGVGPTLTLATQTAGVPGALAPELSAGAPADRRADVYALACLAFELLSGTPPFTGPTAAAILAAHASRLRPRLSARRPALPSSLDAVLERGMALNPQLRPAAAGEFVAALHRALGPEPDATADDATLAPGRDAPAGAATHPSTPRAAARRHPGRRRGAAIAAVVLVAAGGALFGVSLAASDDAQAAAVATLKEFLGGSVDRGDGSWMTSVSPLITGEAPGATGRCVRTARPHGATSFDRSPGVAWLRRRRAAKELPWALERLRPVDVSFRGPRLGSVAAELVGTPAYLAPELAQGAGGDERSDLYGPACVAFEVLTGTPPFTAASVPAILVEHLHRALGLAPGGAPAPGPRAAIRRLLAALDGRPRARRAAIAGAVAAVALLAAGAGGGAHELLTTPPSSNRGWGRRRPSRRPSRSGSLRRRPAQARRPRGARGGPRTLRGLRAAQPHAGPRGLQAHRRPVERPPLRARLPLPARRRLAAARARAPREQGRARRQAHGGGAALLVAHAPSARSLRGPARRRVRPLGEDSNLLQWRGPYVDGAGRRRDIRLVATHEAQRFAWTILFYDYCPDVKAQ